MSTISKLEEEIESLNHQLEGKERVAANNPQDFALSLSIRSLKHQIKELQAQLKSEKVSREREVIEFRLKGKSVDDGSVPLDVLGNVSWFLANALMHGANQIQRGAKARKIPKDIIETLDLRLAGIAQGSARLFITGRNSPDLFGNSLIEGTLTEAFGLLSAETPEALIEKVSRLGKKSADDIRELLQTVVDHELEFSLTWNSPSDKTLSWAGNKGRILSLSNSLGSLTESPPEKIQFGGELVTISSKGLFEVFADDGIPYRGTFPAELLEEMKQFRIGQKCFVVIVRKKITNRITNYSKYINLLESIR